MKNQHLVKKLFHGTVVVCLAIGIAACNTKKAEDTKDIAEEHNDAKFDDKTEKDAQFLVNAAEINIMEIELGQLAATNGITSEVKELGKMMQESHAKTLEELKALAKKRNITLPDATTDDAKDAYKKLADKSGKDFDKEYCDMMVNGHKDAIDKFEKAANDASDADVKEWAASTLPALRKHLDHAMTCQANCSKM